jgi:hypothetical protein
MEQALCFQRQFPALVQVHRPKEQQRLGELENVSYVKRARKATQ